MEPVHGRKFEIPKVFLDAFVKEPRFVLKPYPGFWPVDINLLKSGLMDKLLADKEFAANFEVVIMPRG
jgi:hypothetical protein